jgi:hypothetical protein
MRCSYHQSGRQRSRGAVHQQSLQLLQGSAVDLRCLGAAQMETRGTVDHPRRHLKTSAAWGCCRAASKDNLLAALDDRMDIDHTAKPGMPGIENLLLSSHMGVV